MSDGVLYAGRVNLAVMLSTRDQSRGGLYRSFYKLPVRSHSFSTQRKKVHKGEGSLLKQFLEEPVHTSPDHSQPATHKLPDWMYQAIERYIVQAGRGHPGYALELVGAGESSVSWELQRLLSRRSMRYHTHRSLLAMDPKWLKDQAEDFQMAYWHHGVHFILRMNAFNTEQEMNGWIAQHPRTEGAMAPIDRPQPPVLSDPPAPAWRLWFESMGCYGLPLESPVDEDASRFICKELSNWQLLRAYWNRGPDNPIFNFFNWPLEAAHLHWDRCGPGTVLTKFTCDLRLEIYKQH
jgi:hypothetical protein